MLEHIRLKRGLNIPITGEALCKVSKRVVPTLIALKPTDFRGVTPKLLVKEGDSVIPGTPIFADKKHPEIVFCSPCKGSVSEIVRGDKRKLLAITIKPNNDAQVQSYDIPKLETSDRQEVIDILLKHGLWPCIKQRPYGIIADPGVTPKSIFVSCMNTAPLAANLEFSLQNNFENLQAGLKLVLSILVKVEKVFEYD